MRMYFGEQSDEDGMQTRWNPDETDVLCDHFDLLCERPATCRPLHESVAADTLARYWRGRGAQVRLLSGTDEHGIRIQRKAASLGRTPQDWVDEISEADRALTDRLGISYDDFIRTSEERHKRAGLNPAWRRDTYALSVGARWSGPGRKYNFRLSKYAPQIQALLAEPGFLLPEARRNEISLS